MADVSGLQPRLSSEANVLMVGFAGVFTVTVPLVVASQPFPSVTVTVTV